MRIDSSGVVHAKAGFGTTPVTSCSGFSGTAGYKYLIQPVGAMEPFWAVYSGDNYKGRGKGYFTDDLSGQTLAEVKAGELGTIGIGKVVDPVTGNVVAGSVSNAGVVTPSTVAQGPTTGQIMKSAAINQGFNLASAAVTSKYFSEDPRGQSDSLYLEGKTPLTPLQVWASESNIDIASAYNNPTYGTGDPNYMMNAALYSQDTIGTPTNLPITGEMYG